MNNSIKRAKFVWNDGSVLIDIVGINIPIITFLRKLAGDDKILTRISLEFNDKCYNVIDMKNWHVDSKLKQEFKILYDNEFTGSTVEFF